MENITIRCSVCGKERWADMDEPTQKSISIYEANNTVCSDCLLKEYEKLKDTISGG